MGYMSWTYQKTMELNNTHSWIGEKIVGHLERINQTVEEIHEGLKKMHEQALNEDPLIYVN